ncbi:MAG: VOC family protein [Spirochaetales bacterium]|nr:VOC family protein [Spirochaetales bacterium]
MNYTISGIQQLGVGVRDLASAWEWYRLAFGMDVPVFQDEADAPLMIRYTGGAVQRRNAVLALNLRGGAGFEIWQYKSRTPEPPVFSPALGDLGVIAGVMKSSDVGAAYDHLQSIGADLLGRPVAGPDGVERFFVRDPNDNLFQIAPGIDWFGAPGPFGGTGAFGGAGGVIIGTSNIDAARSVYSDVLRYDHVVYDETGVFADLAGVPGSEREVRRVLLVHSESRTGPFSELLGSSTIELVQPVAGGQRRIYADRYWGDLGFIHLCYDVRGMDALSKQCSAAGQPFTVDSGQTFDMGDAGGRFSYIEDPDGTLIEFVETHKIPILKSLGIGLNLTRRPPDRPLPRWIVRMLGLLRVK